MSPTPGLCCDERARLTGTLLASFLTLCKFTKFQTKLDVYGSKTISIFSHPINTSNLPLGFTFFISILRLQFIEQAPQDLISLFKKCSCSEFLHLNPRGCWSGEQKTFHWQWSCKSLFLTEDQALTGKVTSTCKQALRVNPEFTVSLGYIVRLRLAWTTLWELVPEGVRGRK